MARGYEFQLAMLQAKAVGIKSAVERMAESERSNYAGATFIKNYNTLVTAVTNEAADVREKLPPRVEETGTTYYEIMSYCSELIEMLATYLKHVHREHQEE